MDHQKYIKKAVSLALQNVEEGGKPFGAVIVRDNAIIAEGVNEAVQRGDLTAHAEIEAIRNATEGQRKPPQKPLEGAVLYASGHPCPMCLSAIYLAGIAEVYYASSLEEAEEAGLGVSYIYDELRRPSNRRQIPLKKLQAEEMEKPLLKWKDGR